MSDVPVSFEEQQYLERQEALKATYEQQGQPPPEDASESAEEGRSPEMQALAEEWGQ